MHQAGDDHPLKFLSLAPHDLTAETRMNGDVVQPLKKSLTQIG